MRAMQWHVRGQSMFTPEWCLMTGRWVWGSLWLLQSLNNLFYINRTSSSSPCTLEHRCRFQALSIAILGEDMIANLGECLVIKYVGQKQRVRTHAAFIRFRGIMASLAWVSKNPSCNVSPYLSSTVLQALCQTNLLSNCPTKLIITLAAELMTLIYSWDLAKPDSNLIYVPSTQLSAGFG